MGVGMLKGKVRLFISLLVKKLLLKAIILLSKKYPYPTDVWHPNACLMLEALEDFRKYDANQARKVLWEALFRIAIDEYQRHTFYRGRLDYLVEKIRYGWLPPPVKPMSFWNEPNKVFPIHKMEEVFSSEQDRKLIRELHDSLCE